MENLNFSEFIAILLTRLYELEKNHKLTGFINLSMVAKELNIEIHPNWIFDAGKLLESRGLTTNVYSMGGNVSSKLTGEGRMYVENGRKEENNIIAQYYSSPSNFIIKGDNNQVSISGNKSSITQYQEISQDKKELFNILAEMKKKIESDNTLTHESKNEIKTDLESIELQIKKKEPNKKAIASLLEQMSHISSIAGLVGNLIEFINM
jgi:hypothetical protein